MMDIVHIEAYSDSDLWIPPEELLKLPKKIGILTTVQHMKNIAQVKDQLPNAIIGGQILGCNVINAQNISDDVDAYLYIGSGKFHPLEIKRVTGKDVYTYDPFTQIMSSISHDEYDKMIRKRRASYAKFLSADTIGILVSTKEGQNHIHDAQRLYKYIISESNKKCYMFIGDMITPSEAENYPFIDCFVNTACPRIVQDQYLRPIISFDDLVFFDYIKITPSHVDKTKKGLSVSNQDKFIHNQ